MILELITGRDSIGTWCESTTSYVWTSEKGFGYSPFTCCGQRQNSGFDIAAWGYDWSYYGRGFATWSHSATDCGDEYVDRCVHYQQHNVHVSMLASVLHQSLPIRDPSFLKVNLNLRENHQNKSLRNDIIFTFILSLISWLVAFKRANSPKG